MSMVYPGCVYRAGYTMVGIYRVPWWVYTGYHGRYVTLLGPWWVCDTPRTMVGIGLSTMVGIGLSTMVGVPLCTMVGVPLCTMVGVLSAPFLSVMCLPEGLEQGFLTPATRSGA